MNHEALASAFWVCVITDLQRGHEETRLWLNTGTEVGGFLWWAELSEKDPQWWRSRLLRAWNPPPGGGNSS